MYNLDEIHVWIININEENYQNLQKFTHTLSFEEQKNLNGFKFDKDKQSYMISHVVLKLLIKRYTNANLDDIAFYRNKYGKPYCKWLYFNISRTAGRSCIAFYTNEIGVDMEYINKIFAINDVTEIAFSENEKLILEKTADKQRKFFNVWTKKEAVLKAMGTGIYDELKNLDIGNLKQVNIKYNDSDYLFKIDSFINDDYVGHVAYSGVKQAKIQVYNWN